MRAIDADALLKAIKDLEQESGEYADSFANSAGNRSIEFDRLKDYINNTETLEVHQRIHAHWVWGQNGNDYGISAFVCSNCRRINANIPAWHVNPYLFAGSKFCPHCGAKMTGGNKWKYSMA